MIKIIFSFILSLLVYTGIAQNKDIELLKRINSNGTPFWDKTFVVITESASPITFATPAVFFITGAAQKNEELKKQAYFMGGSLLLANAITTTMKYSIQRERPYKTYSFIEKKSGGGSPAFPSGHTTTAFATATSLSMAFPKWYVVAPAYLWAASVGYSRMYLGVHYPSDVAAGMIIGTGSTFLAYKAQQWLNNRKQKNTGEALDTY
jgi:membrane-associated phospholipid phosphatase